MITSVFYLSFLEVLVTVVNIKQRPYYSNIALIYDCDTQMVMACLNSTKWLFTCANFRLSYLRMCVFMYKFKYLIDINM